MTDYALGKWIVEYQQNGETRAQYGKKVIKLLSASLTEKYGKGFSKTNLEYARRFYLVYENRITQTVFEQFAIQKTQTVFGQLQSESPFTLEEKPSYSESDLESALIDKLQKFLLELGKGYLFEARQKRFTFNEDNYYVDLVFYNRLLRCYVLIDLKVDKLTHQDLGQMQMYVNYYDGYEIVEGENPTIGILMCKEKNDALVEITLPKEANIFASEYSLYLPDKKLLQQKLKEWIAEEEGVK